MTWTSLDRWTCPDCHQTFVADGTDDDIHAAKRAVQERHGAEHRKAAVISAKLRKTDVRRPAPKWGAA